MTIRLRTPFTEASSIVMRIRSIRLPATSTYIPVSGFTMRFHRQSGNVDSVVTTFDDASERVLRKLAAP